MTLHQCRHLYASMSIAAGVNAHALSRYMGHSSIETTFDLYGHLLPANESEAAALLEPTHSASWRFALSLRRDDVSDLLGIDPDSSAERVLLEVG